MARRKTQYQKKPFESDGNGSDVSANIYMSMLMSPAYRALTPRQQQLYTYCKVQYYAEKKKPDDNQLRFTMNRSKYVTLYGLYDDNNRAAFYRDMDALIAHGFVKCVNSGKNTRTKTIYEFSSMWQNYGSQAFVVSNADMTASGAKKNAGMVNVY